jgi:prefoldin alpha subunit
MMNEKNKSDKEMSNDEKQQKIQEKVMQFQTLQQNIEGIKLRLKEAIKSYEEMDASKRTLDEMKTVKKSKTLIQIGAGNFVEGSIETPENVIVSIGGGAAVQKPLKEAIALMDKRLRDAQKVLTEIAMQEQVMQMELQKLQVEAQKMMQ